MRIVGPGLNLYLECVVLDRGGYPGGRGLSVCDPMLREGKTVSGSDLRGIFVGHERKGPLQRIRTGGPTRKPVRHYQKRKQSSGQRGDPRRGRICALSLIHISEPTRRTPISYAVFCLKKKKKI